MTDIRTVKTVKAIREAFIEMIIKNNKVYIPIKEIAEKANINRKTFYLHFECIEDLYKDLEDSTEALFTEILEKNGFFLGGFDLNILLNSLLELINTNYPLYKKLLIEDNYKFLFRNLKDRVKKQFFENAELENALQNEMFFEYTTTGLMKLFRVWVNNKDKMSEEEVVKTAYSIINYGLNANKNISKT